VRENKTRDDEMLVVHKLPAKPDPNKLARSRGAAAPAVAVEREQLELLKRRARAATDPAIQRDIVAKIQRDFGNDKAAELLHELQPDQPSVRPRAGKGTSKA
jgi:hypothetical protein